MHNVDKKKYVIIGTSAAGLSAAMTLRNLDAQANIICVSDEQEIPYNKCLLADYVAGIKTESQVFTKLPLFFEQERITLMLGSAVRSINRKEKNIVLENGSTISYDKLLLGMGAMPIMLPINTPDTVEGIFLFHGLHSANGMLNYIKERGVKTVTIVGGGLTGIECADALMQQGLAVTIIERAEYILGAHVDYEGALLIQARMPMNKVNLMVNDSIDEVVTDQNKICAVQTNNGNCIPTEMLVICVGVRPALTLAEDAGIAVQKNGILTNEYLQTSDESIFAGGDVAVVKHRLTGSLMRNVKWSDAVVQGSYAAHAMAGMHKPYPGISPIIGSTFFGIKMLSANYTVAKNYHENLVRKGDGWYHSFILDNCGKLQGFLMIGGTQHAMVVRRAFMEQTSINPDILMNITKEETL